MESSKPASAGFPAQSGSWCVRYTPAKAASVSALPGATAAARPATFTCHQKQPWGAVNPMLLHLCVAHCEPDPRMCRLMGTAAGPVGMHASR